MFFFRFWSVVTGIEKVSWLVIVFKVFIDILRRGKIDLGEVCVGMREGFEGEFWVLN